jgi:GDP-D-mannose dehydratase
MKATNDKFPVAEAIIAGLVLIVVGIVFSVIKKNNQKKKDTIAQIKKILLNQAGVEDSNDVSTKLLNVKPDANFNGVAAIAKLKSFKSWLGTTDSDAIVTYLQGLNLAQIKSIDVAFLNQESTTLSAWLEETLWGFSCEHFYSVTPGCENYNKALAIIKQK